jgi:hypothetical protein
MRYQTRAIAGLLVLVAAACSAAGVAADPEPESELDEPQGDAGAPLDATPADDGSLDVNLDVERPLVCGDAGFCETRLPRSDTGLPLSLRAIWAVGSNDAWSVTAEGFVLHYDGASWNTEFRANHELYSVWATATSVWVGGEGGLLLHRGSDGLWARAEAKHMAPVRAIYGTDDANVWFAREDAAVDHFDGVALVSRPIDVPGLKVTSIFGDRHSGVYAMGFVSGPRLNTGTYDDRAYVFTLAGDSIALFNASLPQRQGFMPISGAAFDSADGGPGVFLIGYEARTSRFLKWGAFTASAPVSLTVDFLTPSLTAKDIEQGMPIMPYGGDNLWVVRSFGGILRWSGGAGFAFESLAMGYDVVPSTVFDAHYNPAESWIVGDGFALKRKMQ